MQKFPTMNQPNQNKNYPQGKAPRLLLLFGLKNILMI
jgi:hypothetical protein